MSTVPGFTQLTRMPSPTWSAAIAIVSDSTAPFDALYTARSGRPAVAAIEHRLTTAAWGDRRRWANAERITRTIPSTLTSKHVAPLVERVRLDRALGSDAGVVDEDVDAAHRRCRLLDGGDDRLRRR